MSTIDSTVLRNGDLPLYCVMVTKLASEIPLSPLPLPTLTGSTLFVGNLAYSCDEDDLHTFFAKHNHIPTSVRIITADGRSKG